MRAAKSPIAFLIALFLGLPGPPASRAQEIFEAIRAGDIVKVKALVEKDPRQIEARNARQSTPLQAAVDVNSEPIARYLIEKGSDIQALDGNQMSCL